MTRHLQSVTYNHGVHTERGLRPDLKWTTLLSPPGDAGRYAATKLSTTSTGSFVWFDISVSFSRTAYFKGTNYGCGSNRRNCWLSDWYFGWHRRHLFQYQEHKRSKGTILRDEGLGIDLGDHTCFSVRDSAAAFTIQQFDVVTVRTPSWVWNSKV